MLDDCLLAIEPGRVRFLGRSAISLKSALMGGSESLLDRRVSAVEPASMRESESMIGY